MLLGIREHGQKVLLAIKSMGGESTETWRTVLDDLIKRGLRRPEFLIVDGAPGLDKAIAESRADFRGETSTPQGLPPRRADFFLLRVFTRPL